MLSGNLVCPPHLQLPDGVNVRLGLQQPVPVTCQGACVQLSDLQLQAPSWHSPEHIKLKQLDWNNIRVISAVLGQSVALDFYAR